jgi:Ca2+-binding EF-hand superfamily protein
MTPVKSLLGACILGLGLSAAVYGQDNADDNSNQQSDQQLAQRFSQLDSNADGVLSLEEFRQIRGLGRGTGRGEEQPRGERMGQMTPEQREQMRERMQNMTPEQRERMREQMRERRGQDEQADAAHDHAQR